MSSVTNDTVARVYTGGWVNWSKGQALGATLTVNSSTGTLLISFLTLFVAWSGSQLWALLCFTLHQWRSTPDPRDAVHHQQQLLLGLGLRDTDFLWRLLRASWRSRKSNKLTGTIRRQSPLIMYAVTHCVIIFVASILTSRLADTNGEVLLKSPICGWPDTAVIQETQEKLTALPGADAYYMGASWFYNLAREYSQQCYTQSALLGTPSCGSFVQSRVDSKTRFNDPCPFHDEMCETPAVTLDTGIVDSHIHLGINTRSQDRVQFRKVLSCAVIPADRDFSSNWTTDATAPIFPWEPSGGSDARWKYYNLGNQTILGITRPSTFWLTNGTEAYDKSYLTFSLGSFLNDTTLFTAFSPIRQLNRTDADVTLVILHNRAMYTHAVEDPFFRATTHRPDATAMFFTADQEMGVIGCTEQYQFCNGESRCTSLDGWGSFSAASVQKALGYNAAQLTLYDTVYRVAFNMRVFNIMFMLEDTVLLAKDLLYGIYGVSTGLPENQWQREIQNIHNVSLAAMQGSGMAHSSPPNIAIGYGPNSTWSYDWIKQETSSEQQKICRNQKARVLGYYSFSILGLSLMLFFGITIIIFGLTAPSITSYWRRKAIDKVWPSSTSSNRFSMFDTAHLPSYRTQEWKYSDPLHLHEVALEGHGIALPIVPENFLSSSDREKTFQIPWLIDWPLKTFYIE